MSSYIDRGTNGQSDTGLQLRDFLLNGGALMQGDAADPRLAANLAIALKYDPNAKLADNGYGQSYIAADWDKMPKIGGTTGLNSLDMANGKGATLAPTQAGNDQAMRMNGGGGILHGLIDPSKVSQDENYGDVTDSSNITSKFLPEKQTWLDYVGKYGPSLAMMALGVPPAASMLMGGMQTLGQGGKLNPVQLAMNASGFIPGMEGIAPYVGYAKQGMAAYNALNNFNRNPTGSGLTLANIGAGAFGGPNNVG